jgi:hypothetical protein
MPDAATLPMYLAPVDAPRVPPIAAVAPSWSGGGAASRSSDEVSAVRKRIYAAELERENLETKHG